MQTPNKNFQIRADVRQNVVILELEGFLDDKSGEEIYAVIQAKMEAKLTRYVFDFAKVRNICSPAVATLLDLSEKITDQLSGRIYMSGLSELNHKIFEMVGIFLFAEGCRTLQEAEVKAAI